MILRVHSIMLSFDYSIGESYNFPNPERIVLKIMQMEIIHLSIF